MLHNCFQGSFGTGTGTNQDLTCYEADSYDRDQESEQFTGNQSFTSRRSSYRRSRRHSQSDKATEDPEDEMYIDDEQVWH